MQSIRNRVYEELSEFAPVYYEDLVRDNEGRVNIDTVNIIYNIEGFYNVTNVQIRKDVPLIIDFWYPKSELLDVEDMIYQIDKKLSKLTVKIDDSIFRIYRDTSYYINISDNDSDTGRKRLRYIIKYYNY